MWIFVLDLLSPPSKSKSDIYCDKILTEIPKVNLISLHVYGQSLYPLFTTRLLKKRENERCLNCLYTQSSYACLQNQLETSTCTFVHLMEKQFLKKFKAIN